MDHLVRIHLIWALLLGIFLQMLLATTSLPTQELSVSNPSEPKKENQTFRATELPSSSYTKAPLERLNPKGLPGPQSNPGMSVTNSALTPQNNQDLPPRNNPNNLILPINNQNVAGTIQKNPAISPNNQTLSPNNQSISINQDNFHNNQAIPLNGSINYPLMDPYSQNLFQGVPANQEYSRNYEGILTDNNVPPNNPDILPEYRLYPYQFPLPEMMYEPNVAQYVPSPGEYQPFPGYIPPSPPTLPINSPNSSAIKPNTQTPENNLCASGISAQQKQDMKVSGQVSANQAQSVKVNCSPPI